MTPPPTRRTVRKAPDLPCGRTVVLVGMMGAGKTTIGRRLAPRLGLRFFDADDEIQKAAGMSVADLFAAHGEASFRAGEAQVIARLLSGPPHVLATGGGAVLNAETRRRIKEQSISVWIKADVDTLLKRATRRDTRPLLRGGDPRETLARLLEARTPYYAEADLIVESAPGPHSKTVDLIVEALRPLAGALAPAQAAG
ncbi:MAG: shikimate kinase [Parvularculaceae bacterium]|nr:shikimate kinase [Parvularculaceae bacterium]